MLAEVGLHTEANIGSVKCGIVHSYYMEYYMLLIVDLVLRHFSLHIVLMNI